MAQCNTVGPNADSVWNGGDDDKEKSDICNILSFLFDRYKVFFCKLKIVEGDSDAGCDENIEVWSGDDLGGKGWLAELQNIMSQVKSSSFDSSVGFPRILLDI